MPQSDNGLEIEDGDTTGTSTSDAATTSEEQATHPEQHGTPAEAPSPDSLITEVTLKHVLKIDSNRCRGNSRK